MRLIDQLVQKIGVPFLTVKESWKVLSFSCKQGYVPLKTLEYNESCFSIQVWYSSFFKDKLGANDDMCVCFIDLMFRYLVVLRDIHKQY